MVFANASASTNANVMVMAMLNYWNLVLKGHCWMFRANADTFANATVNAKAEMQILSSDIDNIAYYADQLCK